MGLAEHHRDGGWWGQSVTACGLRQFRTITILPFPRHTGNGRIGGMIHPETQKVTKTHGPRPAGKPDQCFYCQQPLGSNHKHECVMRQRTVMMQVTITLPVAVPECWTPEHIEFHRNESSWCAGNWANDLLEDPAADDPEPRCICSHYEAEYLREATAQDEADWYGDTAHLREDT